MKPHFDIQVTISHDGMISVTTVDPQDFDDAREHIMSIMTAIAGDNPIAYSDCVTPQRSEALAQRLANRILRGDF